MNDKKNCFIVNLEGYVFVIPVELRDVFEGTRYYDRYANFSKYLLTEDTILEDVLIDMSDYQCLIDGDFD